VRGDKTDNYDKQVKCNELLPLIIVLVPNFHKVNAFLSILLCTDYPYLAADWQSSIKDRFYDEKSAEVNLHECCYSI